MQSSKQSTTAFAGLPNIPHNDPSLTTSNPVPRKIQHLFTATAQSEGAGALVHRSIGTPRQRNLSPLLLCDHFTIPSTAGFPDHPHRGQETITYLLSGGVEHEDFAGHRGLLRPGDLQFMTAGRGIVHAEMPASSGAEGIQLWVDLPAHLKDCEPRYRDLLAEEIPIATSDDGKVEVKVISGRALGTEGKAELAYTPIWMLDVTAAPGAEATFPLPRGWNAFAYVLQGDGAVFGSGPDARPAVKHSAVVFEPSRDAVRVAVDAGADEAVRFVLVAGMPLEQQIVQHGPFVATSRDGIREAIVDYTTYANGFERAEGWESEIGKRMVH